MKKFTAPSGAEVEIEIAAFDDSCNLQELLCETTLAINIPFEYALRSLTLVFAEKQAENPNTSLNDLQISDLLAAEGVPDILARSMLAIISSKKIKNCIFKCLERSRYNGEAIKPSLFEREESRQDYFPIFKECIRANVMPFIPPLNLGSSVQG